MTNDSAVKVYYYYNRLFDGYYVAYLADCFCFLISLTEYLYTHRYIFHASRINKWETTPSIIKPNLLELPPLKIFCLFCRN